MHGRRAEKVLELAAAGQITLLTSEVILSELYEKLTGKLQWPENRAQLFLETIRELAVVIQPEIVLQVVPNDEDDNRIIECAVTGEAGLIVTFDKDLLRLKSFEMIGIVTPTQLTFLGLGES